MVVLATGKGPLPPHSTMSASVTEQCCTLLHTLSVAKHLSAEKHCPAITEARAFSQWQPILLLWRAVKISPSQEPL